MRKEPKVFPNDRFGIRKSPFSLELPNEHKCSSCVWRVKQSSRLFCPFAACVKGILPDRKKE